MWRRFYPWLLTMTTHVWNTPGSHVWTRQLNSQASRTEQRRESFFAVQDGGFVNTKTWPEHGRTRPGMVLQHLPISFISGFESRTTFYGQRLTLFTRLGSARLQGKPWVCLYAPCIEVTKGIEVEPNCAVARCLRRGAQTLHVTILTVTSTLAP
jgi:hypothetical protein